jgi:endonuclease/exonuclease/phosphatase family metal-dependent hydrolase/MFS family permease
MNQMNNVREYTRKWALTSLIVLFGLQMLRVLFPTFAYYLRDTQGVSALTLGPIAIGVFALSFLAGPLRALLGLRRAVIVTAGGTALLRLAEQLSFNPGLDVFLASAGVALFLMYIPLAVLLERNNGAAGMRDVGFAILLGLAIDTAIHTASGTLDLSWQQGLVPAIIMLLLAVTALAALREALDGLDTAATDTGGWRRGLTLAALGPWIFLQLVIFQNVARMSAMTGWSVPAAGLFIVFGNALGLFLVAFLRQSQRLSVQPLVDGLILVVVLIFIDSSGTLGALLSLVGQVVATTLLMYLFVGLGLNATQPGRMRLTVANGIGALLLVLLSFLFYVGFEMNLGFSATLLLPLAGLLVAAAAFGATQGQQLNEMLDSQFVPAAAAAILLLLPLGLLFTWSTPQPTVPAADNRSVRLMNYNLHNGFNADGLLDMEALVQVIEESGADVVGLQEISRGWLVNGSLDMLQWLSNRLDMPYVFGPTEGFQWGNAVLSRYPIRRWENVALSPESLPFGRGYIRAEIDIGAGTLQVMDTHLHHLEEDSDIRLGQVPQLIDAWNGAARTALVGDMNATPDSPEMLLLAEAGLVDVSAEIGPSPGYTFYSPSPDERIDYIWISPELTPSAFEIRQTTASDHLPLVTTLTLP